MDVLPLLPLLAVWLVVGTLLTIVDLREHRLPNALTMPMLAVVPLGLGLAHLLSNPSPEGGGWSGAGWGAVIWLGVLGLLWLITRGRGMGLGDVKLGPSLGATLGWLGVDTAALGLVLAFVLGGVISLGLLISKRVDRRTAIPFGPFLLAGGLFAVAIAAVG
jgi:leader peptidase (prepilin peptidase) / N-methyltransferase